jgi:hypothetical protein
MYVTLSDIGNPDHGQDPERSVTGLRPRRVEVKDFADASRVCREYIRKHELGGGNWNGGAIKSGNKDIARVSYNGCVWSVPERMNDKPLWAPEQPAAAPNPLDQFNFESAILTVPGYGKIEVSGHLGVGGGRVQTVADKFKVNGERAEFIQAIEFARDDVAKLQLFNYRRQGIWENGVTVTPEMLEAIQNTVEAWYAGEGAAMILRNELVDRRRAVFVEERHVAFAEAEVEKKREKVTEAKAKLDEFITEIEGRKTMTESAAKYIAKKTSEFGQYGIYDHKDKLVPDAPFFVDQVEADEYIERRIEFEQGPAPKI